MKYIEVKYINKSKVGSKRVRLIGNSVIGIDVEFKPAKKGTKYLVLSSDWCKENKILAYPDIVINGKAKILLANISGYFTDIEHNTVIAHLHPLEI